MRITGHSYEAFRGWELAADPGIARYQAAISWLWQQLAWYEFDEAVPPLDYRSALRHARGEPLVCRRVVAPYFADRAKLTGILRDGRPKNSATPARPDPPGKAIGMRQPVA